MLQWPPLAAGWALRGEGVAAPAEDLRGEVGEGPAGRVGLADDELGKAHVRELQPPMPVQQEVLGLEVAVDDEARVEVLQGASDAGRVVAGVRLAAAELPPR